MTIASVLTVVLFVAILNFYSNAKPQQTSQDATVQALVTDMGALAHRYAAIAAPVNQQLAAEMAKYNANENSNLGAAQSALHAEVTTERSFDASVTTWLKSWNNDYGQAIALQQAGVTNDQPVTVYIPYSSLVAKTAQALLTADQASESLITRQAQEGTLFGIQSLNGAHQAANSAVGAQAALLRSQLQLPAA
jgi:uncharacterized protein YigA (DUF484 family)